MQSDCNHYQGLLWDYVAGELSDSESKKIKEHLQGCPSCKQEAEELALIVTSLKEEIPLPAAFTQELHEKLVSVSEEMAEETPSLKQRILGGLKTLPQNRTFRTLAPSLVCLVLVVGVFSSGLFDRWNDADDILTEPTPVPVSVGTEEPKPKEPTPDVTPKPVTPAPVERPVSSSAPEPAAEPEPVPAEIEHSPAPASVDAEETPKTFEIPRHSSPVTCLNLFDTKAFLDEWEKVSGYDWETYLAASDPRELLPGVTEATLVLELPPEVLDSLLRFEESLSLTQENITEEKTEFLIILAGDEE